MKRFRKLIFWCHLVTGTLAGLVVLIMSVTGVLLAYQRQITSWVDARSYTIAPPANGEARLTVEELLARLRESERNAPATLTLSADRAAPVAAGFTGGRALFLNPYTGEILGEGSKATRAFFRTVTDWHRWLGASGENRQAARAVTGAVSLGGAFLVFTGLLLAWRRLTSWRARRFRNPSAA